MKLSIFLFFTVSLLSACSSTPQSRYQQKHDSHPERLPTASELKNPTPRVEPKTRGGNRDYEVWGNSYKVMSNADGFEETGIASWYGKKFHGHLTSNGEVYNMYAMSAAHKNLPLPTYAKVTNLKNNKSVIVRINDRGPFHEDRIIDLSYSAAYKLDMLKTGTAKVKIEAITSQNLQAHLNESANNGDMTAKVSALANEIPNPMSPVTSNKNTLTNTPDKNYIQVVASTNKTLAHEMATAIESLFQQNVIVPQSQGIFRVLVGPINSEHELNSLLASLKSSGYTNAYSRKFLQ